MNNPFKSQFRFIISLATFVTITISFWINSADSFRETLLSKNMENLVFLWSFNPKSTKKIKLIIDGCKKDKNGSGAEGRVAQSPTSETLIRKFAFLPTLSKSRFGLKCSLKLACSRERPWFYCSPKTCWKRKKWKPAPGLSDAIVEPRFSLRRRQHEVFKSSNVNQNVRGRECERHSSANWFPKLALLCRHSEASTISSDTIADKM